MKKNLEKVLIFLFSVLISISFSSCQIGLGSALDLESPEVEILTPLPRESVPGLFNITGTVKDNDSVVKLIVSLDSCTWIWSNNTWTLNGNECKDAEMIQNGKGSYNWKIKNAQIESDGEYTIKVNAYDLPQNTSEKSVATRTVVYDKMAPKVSITYPALYQTEDAIKKELDSYSGDTGYQNYSIIDKFINGKFTVTGNQEEAFTLKYLRLYIYDGGAEVWKSPLYVSKESYIDDVIADGFFTSAEKSAQCYTVTSAIRSFSFDVPKLMNITGKKYLKVVTVSSDASGNIETEDLGSGNKSFMTTKGYFCYYPEACNPWMELNSISEMETNAPSCYPNTKLQGYFYDDKGIEEISCKVKNMETSKTYTHILYQRNKTDPVNYQTKSFSAPADSGTYEVKIEIADVDLNTVTKTGYFKVQDISYPNISVSSPLQTESLFGDSNGDVKFNIVSDDDAGIVKMACVYLKEESDAAYYLNVNDSRWNAVSETQKKFTDANGNILWYLVPKEITSENTESARKYYKPENDFTVNLFSTLGIGTDNALGSQHFIFFVQDSSGQKLSYNYSIQGDITPPKITIDSLFVNGIQKNISDISGTTQNDITDGVSIKLFGTWSEDSVKVWNDVSKLKEFKIFWNSQELSNKSDVLFQKVHTGNGEGNWSCEFVYNSGYASSSGSVVSLSASIKDFANLSNAFRTSFLVDDRQPVLQKITSTSPNNSYGINSEIEIVLKFNKIITVEGNPYLTLNTNSTAVFDNTSNNKQNLVFKYKVASGENTPSLNVLSIDGGAVFKDASSTFSVAIPSGSNLSDNKNIGIVTTAPALDSVSLTGENLELVFNASISKNTGELVITQTDESFTSVPPVLSVSEFNKWKLKDNVINLSDFYELSTNGSDEFGNPDTSEKYVLKYLYNANDSDLLASYKRAELHVVKVPVKSSAVSVSGEKLKIKLTGSYKLPCKGAQYKVSVPQGLVMNVVGTGNTPNSDLLFSLDGIEPPVIRINKNHWQLNADKTSTQPLTSSVKIDCETTGVQIKYDYQKKDFKYDAEESKLNMDNLPEKGSNPPVPISLTQTTLPFDIGDSSWKLGQKFFIAAVAEKGTEKSSISYETAYRSLFVLDEGDGTNYAGGGENRILLKDLANNPDDSSSLRTDGAVPGIWIRGGDSETGPVTTAGFPLNRINENGAALLTEDSTDSEHLLWYYLTWEINTTAYIEVMAGLTDSESLERGPVEWTYGMNAWVPFKKWYALFPGESRMVSVTEYSTVNGVERGNFGFKKETTDRNGNIHTYATSSSGGGGGSSNPQHEPDNSPLSAQDLNLPGQLLTNVVDLSKGDGWVQWSTQFPTNINTAKPMVITIKVDKTFTQTIDNYFIQIVSGWWSNFISLNASVTGASLESKDGRTTIIPDTLENGVIVIPLDTDAISVLMNSGNSLQINGYGVKITSLTLTDQ